MRRRALDLLAEDDEEPMLSAVNLVDVFLLLALLAVLAGQQSAGPMRNAGRPDMELIVREQGQSVRYRGAGSAAQGQGVRAGVACRLADGNIVYIPETAAPANAAPPASTERP